MGSQVLPNPKHPVICSYRRLALKYHPLKCQEPWGPKRFHQLAEAYDVLSDRKWGVSLPLIAGAGRGCEFLAGPAP